MKTLIKCLGDHVDNTVILHGWAENIRSGGKVRFLHLRDGTGHCQCVIEASAIDAFEKTASLGQESSVSITGLVKDEPRAPGGFEISVQELEVACEYFDEINLGSAGIPAALALSGVL